MNATATRCRHCGTSEDTIDGVCLPCFRQECPSCGAFGAVEEWYDRYGIYSGRACRKCADTLPGQGASREYEPDHGEGDE